MCAHCVCLIAWLYRVCDWHLLPPRYTHNVCVYAQNRTLLSNFCSKELLPFGLFIFIVCERIIFIWKSIQINAIWFQSARKADVMYMVMQLDLLFGCLRLGYYFSHCHFMSSVDGASSQLSSVNRLHACTAHVRVCVKSDKNNASEQNKKKKPFFITSFHVQNKDFGCGDGIAYTTRGRKKIITTYFKLNW